MRTVLFIILLSTISSTTFSADKASTEVGLIKTCRYLYSKIPEVLANPNIFLRTEMVNHGIMHAVLNVLPTKTSIQTIPLSKIVPVHPIGTQEAINKTKERADLINANLDTLIQKGKLTAEDMNSIIPSGLGLMKVIQDTSGRYVIADGNGRYYALLDSVGKLDKNFLIEVQLVQPKWFTFPRWFTNGLMMFHKN